MPPQKTQRRRPVRAGGGGYVGYTPFQQRLPQGLQSGEDLSALARDLGTYGKQLWKGSPIPDWLQQARANFAKPYPSSLEDAMNMERKMIRSHGEGFDKGTKALTALATKGIPWAVQEGAPAAKAAILGYELPKTLEEGYGQLGTASNVGSMVAGAVPDKRSRYGITPLAGAAAEYFHGKERGEDLFPAADEPGTQPLGNLPIGINPELATDMLKRMGIEVALEAGAGGVGRWAGHKIPEVGMRLGGLERDAAVQASQALNRLEPSWFGSRLERLFAQPGKPIDPQLHRGLNFEPSRGTTSEGSAFWQRIKDFRSPPVAGEAARIKRWQGAEGRRLERLETDELPPDLAGPRFSTQEAVYGPGTGDPRAVDVKALFDESRILDLPPGSPEYNKLRDQIIARLAKTEGLHIGEAAFKDIGEATTRRGEFLARVDPRTEMGKHWETPLTSEQIQTLADRGIIRNLDFATMTPEGSKRVSDAYNALGNTRNKLHRQINKLNRTNARNMKALNEKRERLARMRETHFGGADPQVAGRDVSTFMSNRQAKQLLDYKVLEAESVVLRDEIQKNADTLAHKSAEWKGMDPDLLGRTEGLTPPGGAVDELAQIELKTRHESITKIRTALGQPTRDATTARELAQYNRQLRLDEQPHMWGKGGPPATKRGVDPTRAVAEGDAASRIAKNVVRENINRYLDDAFGATSDTSWRQAYKEANQRFADLETVRRAGETIGAKANPLAEPGKMGPRGGLVAGTIGGVGGYALTGNPAVGAAFAIPGVLAPYALAPTSMQKFGLWAGRNIKRVPSYTRGGRVFADIFGGGGGSGPPPSDDPDLAYWDDIDEKIRQRNKK